MLSITYRNLESSPTVQALAEELMSRLARSQGEPARCHLVLEDELGAHAHCEARFRVHLELTLPHAHTGVQSHAAHAEATTAVREAYEKAERQLWRRVGRRDRLRRAERA